MCANKTKTSEFIIQRYSSEVESEQRLRIPTSEPTAPKYSTIKNQKTQHSIHSTLQTREIYTFKNQSHLTSFALCWMIQEVNA